MKVLLVLVLLSVCLAQYHPIDFAAGSARGAGEPYWLPSGMHTASVSDRTILNSAYIEINLFPEQTEVDCLYSVWFNGAKVSYGAFVSAASSVIPLIPGSLAGIGTGGSDELAILTQNCWVGRYAVPFVMGQNNNSLYLVDVTPTAQNNLQSFGGLPNQMAGDGWKQTPWLNTNPAGYLALTARHNSLCRFSSQACESDQFPLFQIFYVEWSGSSFAASDTVVIESNAWYSGYAQLVFALCDVNVICNDPGNYTIGAHLLNLYVDQTTSGATVKKRAGYTPAYRGAHSAMNSTRTYYRHYYTFTPNSSAFDNSLIMGASAGTQIHFPYVKVWNPAVTDDPFHILVDMRAAAPVPGSSGVCSQETGDGRTRQTDNGYPFWGDIVSGPSSGRFPSVWETTPDDTINQQTTIYCGNDQSVFLGADLGCTQLASEANDLSFTQAPTSLVVNGNIEAPFGGVMTVLHIDNGIPFITTATGCPYAGNGINVPALNQMSRYNISINGNNVATLTTSTITRFDRNNVGGYTVVGFHVGELSGATTFQYRAIPPFSLYAAGYIAFHPFPAPLCDDSQCDNGFACADPDNLDSCACNQLYTGQNCSDLAVFCPTNNSDICLNGGTCVENDQRAIRQNAAGEDYVENATMCDCSTALGVTGPYRGDFCQLPPPCDAEPCFNKANCTNLNGNDFTCDCSNTQSPNSSNPFTGVLCEISGTSVCDSNPCENGGTCQEDVNSGGRFNCTCTGGWTGATCNLAPVDQCPTPTQCVVGVCIPSSDTSAAAGAAFTQCVCAFGYTGPKCDVPPAACANTKCDNGGRCVGFPGNEEATACVCPQPWVGDYCQFNTSAYIGIDEE